MRLKCEQPFSMIKILKNGDIYMCPQGQPANINAFTHDPLEIWNSKRFLELRRQLDTEDYDSMCKTCPLVQDFSTIQEINLGQQNEYLSLRLNGDQLFNAEGQLLPISSNEIFGYLEKSSLSENGFELSGWVIDLNSFQPAKHIIIFNHVGVPVGICSPSLNRSDIEKYIGKNGIDKTGFKFEIAKDKLENNNTSFRIFAVTGNNSFGELYYFKGYPLKNSNLTKYLNMGKFKLNRIRSKVITYLKKTDFYKNNQPVITKLKNQILN